jgi:hypothetical protein
MLLPMPLAGGAGVAQPPVRKSTISPAVPILSESLKAQAAQALNPGVSAADLPVLVARWETAWARAQAAGLLTSPEGKEALGRRRREALGIALLDSQPGHAPMTEAQVREAFLSQGEERKVSHLLCRTEEEAAAALKRIKDGEAFDKVAPEVSTDPTASQNRGDLGWIRQKQMVKAFGDPVFTAEPGTLVGPFKTDFGWHVAKVHEARNPKPEDFPAVKEALMKEAAAYRMSVKRNAALESLRSRFPLTPDMTVLEVDRTTQVMPGDDKRIAGKVAGTAITLRELKLHMGEVFKSVGPSHSLGASTKRSFMEGLADQIRLAAAARAKGLERKPAVQGALWAAQHQEAYRLYATFYLGKLEVSEAQLKQHHEAHPDRFLRVGKLRLQVLVSDSEEAAINAMNQVRLGMPWGQAVAQFGNAEATGNPEPGWVDVADLQKMLSPASLKPLLTGPLGQPVGPVLASDGYTLFQVQERRSGTVMPLDECRELVSGDFLKSNGRALVDQSLDN